MSKVIVRGDSVYQCNQCNRKCRVPTNRKGIDVLSRCTITTDCKGKLFRVTATKDIMDTPTITPVVPNLQDWVQHKLLHNHTQSVASTRWVVTHGLQCRPNIDISTNKQIAGKTELYPYTQAVTRETVDQNTTILTFPKPESGTVQFVTMASQNTTNPLPIPTIVDVNSSTQVSTNTGLLTICTLSDAPIVNIVITFVISGGSPINVLYQEITNVPSAASPWAGTSQVFVNGKTYYVRSIDIVNNIGVTSLFLSGAIPPAGCFIYLSTSNYINTDPGSVLILGSTAPHGVVDRVYNKYIDFGIETANTSGVLYNYGKIHAKDNKFKTTHPLILVV